MTAKLIKIGNSQGIRIPKSIVDQLGLGGDLELAVSGDTLVVRQRKHPRDGWEVAAREMHERGEDKLLDGDLLLTTVEEEEWGW